MTLFQKSGDTRDIDREILLNYLEDPDLFNFCLLSNKYISSLCNNEAFWEERAKRWISKKEFFDFKLKNKSSSNTFKNTYKLFRELQSLKHELELYLKSKSVDEIFNLQTLDLGSSKFQRVSLQLNLPDTIGNLSNLRVLYLRNNELRKLPDTIGNLSNLEELYLYNNELKELPKTIGNLSKLQILELSNNQLLQIPREIGNLSKLKILYLHFNQLLQIPEEIGNLSKLQYFSIYDNNQLLRLPDSIGNLSNLQTISFNQFKKLPDMIEKKLKSYGTRFDLSYCLINE